MTTSNLQQSKKGVLLVNVGTPDTPQVPDVRRYLRQFLMDPFVIDISSFARWCLVHLLILPSRPQKSALAYQKIWTPKGSPLFMHLLDLTEKAQGLLGEGWKVLPGMRYGNPSIESAIQKFREEGITEIVLFPLYPQYSLAATQSSIEECKRVCRKIYPQAQMTSVKPFYDNDLFIKSFAKVAQEKLSGFSFDHILFSFHGLPERQVTKTDRSGAHCLQSKQCCEELKEANQDCYRAQSYRTARLIAEQMNLSKDRYTVCFQSRLGRTPWIQPFTDVVLQELPQKSVKRLGVICPSFVADCLETLEEIQIRGCEDFRKHGGEDLKLVPSLNGSDSWAEAVKELILDSSQHTHVC